MARLGSTRLNEKHLIKALDKTFIQWLVSRLRTAFSTEIETGQVRLFITTSNAEVRNQYFEVVFADEHDVTVFYGADDNIPLRQLQAADKYNIDTIISIDGDDILCSTEAARFVLTAMNQGADRAYTTGLPLGMNVAGYKTAALRKALDSSKDARLETGWGRIFDSIPAVQIPLTGESPNLRLTLDYDEDALFFKRVIEQIGDSVCSISDDQLINYIVSNQLFKLNASLNEQYWQNFATQKNNEVNNE